MAPRLAVSLAICLARGLPPALALRPEAHNEAPAAAQVSSSDVAVLLPWKTEVGHPDLATSSLVQTVEISTLDGILIATERVADFGTSIEVEAAPSGAAGDAEEKVTELHSEPQRPSEMEIAEAYAELAAPSASATRRTKGKEPSAVLEAAASDSSTADEVVEADTEQEGEFLPALACVENPQGQRIGCKGACACLWWEWCYARRTHEKPFEDTGVCEMSMKVMSGLAIVVSLALLLITLSSRIILQERDLMQALKVKNFGTRSMRESLYAVHGKAIAQAMAAKGGKR